MSTAETNGSPVAAETARDSVWLYSLPPVDWWQGWREWGTFAHAYAEDELQGVTEGPTYCGQRRELELLRAVATVGFLEMGWEGDGRWLGTVVPRFHGNCVGESSPVPR